MLGVIIGDDQTGVNDAGDPAEQSQQETQEKTTHPARQEDGDGRENDAEKVTERFHGDVESLKRYIVTTKDEGQLR